jgi:hypothetical protein
MRNRSVLILAFALCAGPATAATVKVNFVDPQHYADIGSYGGIDRKRNLDEIEKIFQKLGDRYLSADQVFSIDVLDVDLAGRLEPWHNNAYDIRYMRDITWPRMKLRYTLEGAGHPPASSEETLSDPSYLDFPHARFSDEPLPYDKAMIERWFRKEFAPPAR